jgi:hypothetical protein
MDYNNMRVNSVIDRHPNCMVVCSMDSFPLHTYYCKRLMIISDYLFCN